MAESSWPLWAERGIRPSSHFYEALDFDGAPHPSPESRVRTQARQVFSFALANELGWDRESTAFIVKRGLPALLSCGLRSDGIAGRVIDIDTGELLNTTADLYDTAFCLLAIAQSRAIVGANAADSLTNTLLSSIDAGLRYEDGSGYRETLPAGVARLQNPHMHFFESLLQYFEKSGRGDIRERAEELLSFVARTFFDEEAGIVRESVDANGASAGYDPGHSMEWVWLLGYRARLFDDDLPPFAYRLYERACAAHEQHGWTCLYLDDDNQAIDGSARLWSQTEALKGHLCVAEVGQGAIAEKAIVAATECAREILDVWLQSEAPGGWLDHFGPDRSRIADVMPASTGYHLYLAIAELTRVASRND